METSTQTSNPTQTSGYDDPVVAQQARNLTKAIFQHESGMDYNAKGDAGTSTGAGQWQAGTWKAQAQDVLGDPNAPMTPENQSVVAQGTIRKLITEGKNAAQIAAIWNSGNDKNWENKVGTTNINGQQIKYNVPQYVKSVTDLYQQYKGQSGQQPQATGFNPTPYSNPSGVNPGAVDYSGMNAQPDTQGDTSNAPESLLQKAGDVAKGVGNFLFPVIGDIVSAIQGKGNGKTVLQVAGDVGLSALPFIPGLGEVGLAGKTAEGAGLLAKVASSPVARGALTGYGAGVASNLSQGQGIGQALTPNLSNVGGAVLGGAAPVAMKALGGLSQKFAGISPQMANDLRSIGANDTKGFQKYMDAAAQRTQTSMAPSAINVAANAADTAAQKIKSMLSTAGGEVGNANRAAEAVSLAPEKIAPVATALNEGLSDRFGVKIVTNTNGELSFVPTRRGGVTLSPQEQSRVLDIANRINEMGTGGNVRMADDIMSELDKKVDYGVQGQDPLKGLFKTVRGQLNGVARDASPKFAAANDRVVALKTLLKETQDMAGKDTQRGELLMRRVFTGDKGADVQQLFDKIKDTTGIDLKKEALFAKYATEAFGNQDDKTLLEKMITGTGTGGLHGGIMSGLIHGAQTAAKATFASPERIGKKLIQGTKQSVIPGLMTKAAARAGSSF